MTLADFAADVRAPTPSAAAEVVVPDRMEFLSAVRGAGRRLDGAATGRLRTVAREVVAERRALDRLSPLAQLASMRERVGLLLDRGDEGDHGVRRDAADDDRASRRPPGDRSCRPAWLAIAAGSRVPTRSTRWRSGGWPRPGRRSGRPGRRLRSSGRRRRSTAAMPSSAAPSDARIVRDPADAPPGTRLALRVARGDLPATVDDR